MESVEVGLLDLGDRPAEPDQLTCGSDRDDRAPLVALLKPSPGAMQPALRGPRDSDRLSGPAGLSVGENLSGPRRFALVPRRFDEQSTGVR
jgi:hypothetical protein